MRFVHVALLGDPTLRMHYVAPPKELQATVADDKHVHLSWQSAEQPLAGYHIYRRSDTLAPWERVNEELVTDTVYSDFCLLAAGTYTYLVRSMALIGTPSGTYYNLSTGISTTATIEADYSTTAAFSYLLHGDTLMITENTSTNATSWLWLFGDGTISTDYTPVHIYANPGNYQLMLVAISACDKDTVTQEIVVLPTSVLLVQKNEPLIYPNPASGMLMIRIPQQLRDPRITIFSANGIQIFSNEPDRPGIQSVDVSNLPAGNYTVHISGATGLTWAGNVILQ
jgi:PKD repeat protein